MIVIIIGLATPLANVNASGLGISDFAEYPEQVCVTYGDRPEMKDLCDWIDICDDSDKVNSTSKFCTSKAVRNIPYPPGGRPKGFHSVEDDESGLVV
jgi:hypothetical protein